MVPRFTLCAALSATALACAASAHADGLAAIRLDAERMVIRPDGRSTTVLSATVYDDRGNLVPDNTRVRFTTSAGRLDTSVAATRNGVARVTLTSSDQPGDALITAVLEGAAQASPVRLTITFSREADSGQTGTPWIRISGTQYTGYTADTNPPSIQANGKDSGAVFMYRGVRVSADTLQLDVHEIKLLAVGNVQVQVNGTTRKFNNLVFSFTQNAGVAERQEGESLSAFELKGRDVTEIAYEPGRFLPPGDTYQLRDLSQARVAVVARAIAVEPGRQLQCRNATFYVEGQKTYSTRYHVMAIDQDTIYAEQLIGITAQGPTLDFPYYYDMRPNGVGTVHVRRAARVSDSAYSQRAGISFDVLQSYNGANNRAGTLELNGLSRGDWGARLRHSEQLAPNTNGSFFVDFPSHKSLFATGQVSRSFQSFLVNGSLSASRTPTLILTNPTSTVLTANTNTPATEITEGTLNYKTVPGGDLRGILYAETFDRAFFKQNDLRYALNLTTSRQTFYGDVTGTVQSEIAGGRLFTTPRPFDRVTRLTQTVALNRMWYQTRTWYQGKARSDGASSAVSLLGTTNLVRDIPGYGTASLAYDYTQSPRLDSVNSSVANGRHRLSLTSYMSHRDKWQFSLTSSKTLDKDFASLFGEGNFIIYGPWRGRVRYSYNRFLGVSFPETEYKLIRRIQGHEVAAYYSTLSHRIQLDFAGARF